VTGVAFYRVAPYLSFFRHLAAFLLSVSVFYAAGGGVVTSGWWGGDDDKRA